MPFRSQAQRKFLFAKKPRLAEEFARKTPKGKKLPKKIDMARLALKNA